MTRKATLLGLAASLACSGALAQAWPPTFTFSGYGTAGAVTTDEDRGDYLVDAFKPDGPGYSDRVSLKVDSRLGGQLIAGFGPRVSVVVQVLAEQHYDKTWTPHVEWANVKLQATDDLAVRGGRMVLPIFMVTDSRRVGYANPWVRPPVEMYSLVPVTHYDGADAVWPGTFGTVNNTVQLSYGRSDSHFPNASGFDAGTAEARDIVAINDTLEVGAFSARLSYGEAKLTIAAYRPLFDALRLFGPQGEALAQRYGVDDRRVTFSGVGASYDPGAWFLMGEAARFDTRSIVGKKSAWYVSGGARLGAFTPYATFARLRGDSPRSDPGVSLAGLPPQVAALGQLANETLNRQLAALPEQKTASLGVRWDFWRSAALKVQWDHVKLGAGSYGTFGNIQPGFPFGGAVNVYSAAVDFVF